MGSTNIVIPSVKLFLMLAGALSLSTTVGLKLKLCGPISMNAIWSVIMAWLKPPYLYITINFIIITIGLTSRFSHAHEYHRPASSIVSDIKEADSLGPPLDLRELPADEEELTVVAVHEDGGSVDYMKDEEIISFVNEEGGGGAKDVDEYEVVEAAEMPENSDNHQTLDSTWKMIMDKNSSLTMNHSHTAGSKNGSTDIQKELSSGQDELNRRVEEFIKKINQDMRLERERSLDQHIQTVKGLN